MHDGATRQHVLPFAALGAAVVAGAAWAALDPLHAAVTALCGLMLAPFVHRLLIGQQFEPLEPLWPFLACYAVSFALKPLLVVNGVLTYPWTKIDEPGATVGVMWALVSLVFTYIGYFAYRPRRAVDVINGLLQERSPAFVRVSAALLTFGGAFAIFEIARISGVQPTPDAVFSELFRRASFEAVYGRGYLTVLLSMSIFGPAAQWYVALTTRKKIDYVLGVVALMIATAVVLCFYSRQLLMQMFIVLLVVLHFKGGWFKPRTLVTLGAALLVFAGGLGLRRLAGSDSPIARLSTPLAAVAFLGSTFDSFEFLVPAVQRMSVFGELSGQSLFEDVVWTFIPRALVPNKPDTYGYVLVQNAIMSDLAEEGRYTGTYPAGYLAEWYVNFGVCGLLFISLLYGLMLKLSSALVQDRDPRLIPLLIYGGIILNLVGLFRSSSQMLVQGVIYTVLLLILFARGPSRAPLPSPVSARPVRAPL
jgi:hypothetical protein